MGGKSGNSSVHAPSPSCQALRGGTQPGRVCSGLSAVCMLRRPGHRVACRRQRFQPIRLSLKIRATQLQPCIMGQSLAGILGRQGVGDREGMASIIKDLNHESCASVFLPPRALQQPLHQDCESCGHKDRDGGPHPCVSPCRLQAGTAKEQEKNPLLHAASVKDGLPTSYKVKHSLTV